MFSAGTVHSYTIRTHPHRSFLQQRLEREANNSAFKLASIRVEKTCGFAVCRTDFFVQSLPIRKSTALNTKRRMGLKLFATDTNPGGQA
eukprot:3539614-Amphidinium_carterae.1